MKTTDIKSIGQSPLRLGFLLIALALACFCLLPGARATDLGGVLPNGNTADGLNVLTNLTTGGYNTGIGWFSLRNNISGNYNTGVGAGTLFANTGNQNTATGAAALFSNTSGFRNTANGAFALLHNNAADNTAVGNAALFTNSTGSGNTAIGNFAIVANDTGSDNTAMGNGALSANTTANDNTAVGAGALAANTGANANENTAIGAGALGVNTSGFRNTAVGIQALQNNTTGDYNIGIGLFAGQNVSTASNVYCIGAAGQDVNNTTWIGNIYGVTTQSGFNAPVIVSDHGQLGTVASSERFKKDIVTMDKSSEAILSLRPVTFHYKTDAKGIPQFGLIAEEVAKVNPALVLPDKEGKPYTVRYDQVNAMLLNEFLKEHRKVQELQATLAEQSRSFQSKLAEQEKQIAALTAGLQRMRGQVEPTKSAPGRIRSNKAAREVVLNNY
jgi:trimeric autotransporter adhesin